MEYDHNQERELFHEYLEQEVEDSEGFKQFLSLLPPDLFKIYAIKIASQWNFDPQLVLEELVALVGDDSLAAELGPSSEVRHTKLDEVEPIPEEFTVSDTEFAAKSWGIIL